MKKLHPEEAWDKDAELDGVDDAEAAVIAPGGDDDDFELPEDIDSDSEWFDDLDDDEVVDYEPITEEDAMDWARRFGGGW